MTKGNKMKLIEEATINKSDYTWPEMRCTMPLTGAQERTPPREIQRRPPEVWDTASHLVYEEKVPFDMFLGKKDIVGTDPREKFVVKVIPESDPAGNVRRTRPRRFISPGVPLDDVEDETLRNTLIKYVYISTAQKAQQEGALGVTKPPGVLDTVISDDTAIKYAPELYPLLPDGWLCAAKHWDSLQNRMLGDPFKTFWTRRGEHIVCGCCENPIPSVLPTEEKMEIAKHLCSGRLRQTYNHPILGYSGFIPMVGKGVPLELKKGFGMKE